MKITKVDLAVLPLKHYSTDLYVTVESDEGYEYVFTVSISGYGPKPSFRELERGWEPDWGMDHVESDVHLFLAEAARSYLKGPQKVKYARNSV